jgi:hypothetical protein
MLWLAFHARSAHIRGVFEDTTASILGERSAPLLRASPGPGFTWTSRRAWEYTIPGSCRDDSPLRAGDHYPRSAAFRSAEPLDSFCDDLLRQWQRCCFRSLQLFSLTWIN